MITYGCFHCSQVLYTQAPPHEETSTLYKNAERVDAIMLRCKDRNCPRQLDLIFHRKCLPKYLDAECDREHSIIDWICGCIFGRNEYRDRWGRKPHKCHYKPFPINETHFFPRDLALTQELFEYMNNTPFIDEDEEMRGFPERKELAIRWQKPMLSLIHRGADPCFEVQSPYPKTPLPFEESSRKYPLREACRTGNVFFIRALFTHTLFTKTPYALEELQAVVSRGDRSHYISHLIQHMGGQAAPLFSKQEFNLFFYFLEEDEEHFFEAIDRGADRHWALIMCWEHQDTQLADKLQQRYDIDLGEVFNLAIQAECDRISERLFPQVNLETKEAAVETAVRQGNFGGVIKIKRLSDQGVMVHPRLFTLSTDSIVLECLDELDAKTVKGILTLSFLSYQARKICRYYWIYKKSLRLSIKNSKCYAASRWALRRGQDVVSTVWGCLTFLFRFATREREYRRV